MRMGALLGVLVLSGWHVSAQTDVTHTWTDGTGKHQTEAEFVRVEGTDLVLRKSDGKQITVPLDKLCETDQAIAQELQATRNDRLAIERVSRQFAQLLRQTKRDGAEKLITAKSKELWAAQQSPIKDIPNVDRGSKPRIRDVEVDEEEATAVAMLRYKGKTMPAVLHLRNEEGDWLIYAATGEDEEGQELHFSFEGAADSPADGNVEGTPIATGPTVNVGLPRPVSPNRVNPLPIPTGSDPPATTAHDAQPGKDV